MSDGLTINVDLDGVVYDFPQAFINMVEAQTRSVGLTYPRSWDWWDEWGMAKGEWLAWFRKGVESGAIWREGPSIQGARRALWALSEADHYLRIVTHRTYFHGLHEQAVVSTAHWLHEHNIPFRALSFEERKRDIAADVVVDDRPDLSWTQPGALNLLFGQPYNRQPYNRAVLTYRDQVMAPGAVLRVESWAEAQKLIERYKEQYT